MATGDGMTTVRISDKDHGAKARLAELNSGLQKLSVGFHADAGARDDDSGLSVIDVVTFHEFGLGVPRRSIVADWVEQNRSEIERQVKRVSELVAAGKLTKAQALNQLGLWAQGSMQARVSQGIPPPLAQSTIDRKGSSVPLINTGQTRASITYRVGDS
jgi:hypothetical protein